MTDTFHHLPGRLRIRMAVLRRNPLLIARIRALLGGLHGVLKVDASSLTGSVLVHYDSRRTSGRVILDALAEGGFTPPSERARPLDALAETAVSLATDRIFDRGASLLLAAII